MTDVSNIGSFGSSGLASASGAAPSYAPTGTPDATPDNSQDASTASPSNGIYTSVANVNASTILGSSVNILA